MFEVDVELLKQHKPRGTHKQPRFRSPCQNFSWKYKNWSRMFIIAFIVYIELYIPRPPFPSKNVYWTWSFNPVGEDNWCLKQGAAGRCTDLLAVVVVFNTLKGTQVRPWSEAPVNCGEWVCRSVGEYHRQGCQLVVINHLQFVGRKVYKIICML